MKSETKDGQLTLNPEPENFLVKITESMLRHGLGSVLIEVCSEIDVEFMDNKGFLPLHFQTQYFRL